MKKMFPTRDLLNSTIRFFGDDDGTGGDDGSGDDGGAGGAGDDGGTKTPPSLDAQTQEHLNSVLAAEKKKFRAKLESMQKQLEEQGLKGKQLETAQNQLEELRGMLRTKEETIEHEKRQAEAAHRKEIESLTTTQKEWENRYTNERIQRSLLDAAQAHEAFNPQQIVQMLSPQTELRPVIDDDGNPTGEYQEQVSIVLPNDKGEMTPLILSPQDALKRLSESESHGNLFKRNVTGGLGNSQTRGGKKNLTEMSDEEYFALRQKQMNSNNT